MRVLLVAPRHGNLSGVDEEIQNVLRSGLEVTPLLGVVGLPELMREIRSGQYDVLWFATHGSPEGIQLSDAMLSAEELVPLVRERFGLVVLNSCSSLLTAQLLQEEANVAVICTLLDVEDRQAYQTGSRLASALYESVTIVAAYLASKPGRNRSYLYLPSLSPSDDTLSQVMSELKDLRKAVDRQRSWERKALLLSLSLHPITWFVMWFLWSKA